MTLTRAAAVLLDPDAPRRPLVELYAALVEAVRADGVPVDRASCSVPLLHPEQRSTQLIWTLADGTRAVPRTWSAAGSAMFATSPMRPLVAGEATVIRHRIEPGSVGAPYAILDELAAEGFTDYLATVTRGELAWERAPLSWATRAPGGFDDTAIQALLGLMPVLGLILAIHAYRGTTRALMDTYLGADAASRVLDGHIRRGDVVDVEAAVCFCDMRDFTALSQTLGQAELLELLDDAFGVVVGAMEAERGEILKFIGDAVLAVFRVEGGEEARRDAVARALRAARGTVRRAAEVSDERREAGKPAFQLGVSIHLGHVAYGNIGAPTRLDFTVIGAAVNLAARLEGTCRALGAPIVLSDAAASRLPPEAGHVEDLGTHALRGIAEPVQVWGARG